MTDLEQYKPMVSGFFLIILLGLCGCSLRHGKLPTNTVSSGQVNTAKPPPISEDSRATDIAAYVTYYKSRGYTITVNKQSFDASGNLVSFRFAAARHTKGTSESVRATVNTATHTVSTTSNSDSSSTTIN